MSARTGHYLKPGVRVSAPGVLFSVVIDPHIESSARSEADTFHTWGGADVCCSHWRRDKWTPTRGARCDTPEQLAAWMAQHADKRRRNYVVTPDAAESLALGGVWEAIDDGPVKWVKPGPGSKKLDLGADPDRVTVIRRITLGQRCTILDYLRKRLRWVWVSASQFFGADEETLASAFGHQWDTDPYDPVPGVYIHRNAKERSKLWLKSFQELCDWWRANARAPFGLTASSLAMGILRTHIAPKAITTHKEEWAHRLERSACFGGMVRTWYYGDIGTPSAYHTDEVAAPAPSPYGSIPGPVTHVDVRSMYPSLLRDREFPVALTSYREDYRREDPQAYAQACGVIADVTIETEVPEYPCRAGGHVVYPVGRFRTQLTGPELLRLRADGKVIKCWSMAKYRMGRPFAEAARVLLDMRERAKREGRPGWELLAKTMANGMGGKLAQRKGAWVERPDVAAVMGFGEWFRLSNKTGREERFRAVAWCTSEYRKDPTGAGPYTAAFAYLAAYGRLQMRAYRDECDDRGIVSMDTDGLWLIGNGDGLARHWTGCSPGATGHLRIVETCDAARFFGPRHYYTPGSWVLAGFAHPTVTEGGRGVRDSQRFAPVAGPAGRAPRGVCVRQRASSLSVESHGARVGRDGWAIPRRRTS